MMVILLPLATAITGGSMLDPPICASPETTACTVLVPEARFSIVTSSPWAAKKPSFMAMTTSELAKLVLAVGRAILMAVLDPAGEAVLELAEAKLPQPARIPRASARRAKRKSGITGRLLSACDYLACER